MTLRVKIIGLGGIGSYLTDPLIRYLDFKHDDVQVTLVDGDSYEEKNRQRQQFIQKNNKAAETSDRLISMFPRVQFRVRREYVTEDNVVSIIREDDLVFLCVDNHATRKLISDRCEELDNVVLISGGNEYTDGNVIYFFRKNGDNVTLPPTQLDRTIAQPQDKNPGDAQEERSGCQEEAEAAPQLVFTNNAIASRMCCVYYAHEQGKAKFHQVYDDILTQCSRPSPEFYEEIEI